MAARYGADVKTVRQAWGEFRRKRSPQILFGGRSALALVAAHRRSAASAGGTRWPRPLMLPVYVLGEWAIHVYLLHLRPFRWRGREVELITAQSHRMHHEDPHNLFMILLGPVEAVGLLVLAPMVAAVFAPFLGWHAAFSAAVVAYGLILTYEWTHFLIHTAVRPRSRYYRTIHRGHRLHHFKNERYWHGITNTLSDRVLGTAPDQQSVPRSTTARTLRP